MTEYLSQSQFAQLVGVSRQAVSNAIQDGRIIKTSHGIDPQNPENVYFARTAPEHSVRRKNERRRLRGVSPIIRKHGETSEQERLYVLKKVEEIKKLQLDREQKRKTLVPRKLTEYVFHKIYEINANEFRAFSNRIVPEIASCYGVDDDEKLLAMNRLFQKEIDKTLNHIMRIINDFMESISAEQIE